MCFHQPTCWSVTVGCYRVSHDTNWYVETLEPIGCSFGITPHQTFYSDIIMGTMASPITRLTIVSSNVYSGADQRAPLHWPLCGEFTGDTKNASIWWRHHMFFTGICPTRINLSPDITCNFFLILKMILLRKCIYLWVRICARNLLKTN